MCNFSSSDDAQLQLSTVSLINSILTRMEYENRKVSNRKCDHYWNFLESDLFNSRKNRKN